MIKKIYDRDTGNIYDVGGSNKLKLVDTALYNENKGEYNFTADIKLNTCYLLHCIDDNNMGIYSTCVVMTGNSNNTAYTPVYIISNSEDNSALGFLGLSVRTKNIFIQLIVDNNGSTYNDAEPFSFDKIEIYELPFSL